MIKVIAFDLVGVLVTERDIDLTTEEISLKECLEVISMILII